jgi:hypothetical protein
MVKLKYFNVVVVRALCHDLNTLVFLIVLLSDKTFRQIVRYTSCYFFRDVKAFDLDTRLSQGSSYRNDTLRVVFENLPSRALQEVPISK